MGLIKIKAIGTFSFLVHGYLFISLVSNVGYPKIIGAVSVINHYFKRDDIKLGAYKGKFGNDFSGGMSE